MANFQSKVRRLLGNLVLGTRREFGDDFAVIEHATAAALRRRRNWTLPWLMGLGILFPILFILVISAGDTGIGYGMARIIPLDYLVFFIGWLCAWNAATRWRANHEFVEALVITPLRPRVVGNLLLAGSMPVWAWLFALVGVLEILAFAFLRTMNGMWYSTKFVWSDFLSSAAWTILQLPVVIPFYLVMAWFHLETIRIAYWMFAVAALPRVSLRRRALLNFFLIPLYVTLLTGIGSIITGMAAIPTMLAVGIIGSVIGALPDPGGHIVWMLSAIPGLLLVGYIKREVARLYEKEFESSYLLFTWWGAGETEHPAIYPRELQKSLGSWQMFLRKEEAALRQGNAP